MHIEYVKIGEDGRVVIPSAFRRDLHIQPGDTLVIESDGDSLLVRGYEQVLDEVQAAFVGISPTDTILSDELLADRREEAARDCRD